MPGSKVRSHARLIQAAAVLLVLAATVVPEGDRPGGLRLCFLCAEHGLSEFLLNVLLFVPLGLVLAWSGHTLRRALLRGALLSVAIECSQWFIPGRFPSPEDVVANSLGTLVGAMVFLGAAAIVDPPPHRRVRMTVGAALLALLVPVLTALLVRPSFPPAVWFGQWTQRQSAFAAYRGFLIDASMPGMPLRSMRLTHSGAARESLLSGTHIRLGGVAGPEPRSPAPLFNIADDAQRFDLMVLVMGQGIDLRYRTAAEDLRLTSVDLRFPDALGGLRAGDTLALEVWRAGPRWCIAAPSGTACQGANAASLWRMLSPQVVPPNAAVDVLWMAIIFLPLAYWGVGAARATGIAAALLTLVILPFFPGGPAASLLPLAGAVAGSALGLGLSAARTRHLLRRGMIPA